MLGPSGTVALSGSLWQRSLVWFWAYLPLLLYRHLDIPDPGLAQSVLEGGGCLHFALISSFFGFLLFMARETGFPFLVVT